MKLNFHHENALDNIAKGLFAVADAIRKNNKSKLTLTEIRNSWELVINEVEKHNSKLGHFLESSSPKRFHNQILYIAIEGAHKFQIRTLEKDVQFIEDSFYKVFNHVVNVEFKQEK